MSELIRLTFIFEILFLMHLKKWEYFKITYSTKSFVAHPLIADSLVVLYSFICL